jgi:hypothetical protein
LHICQKSLRDADGVLFTLIPVARDNHERGRDRTFREA